MSAQFMPTGTLKSSAQGRSDTFDANSTFALMPFVDFKTAPNFSIGLAPRYIFNVKPDGFDGDSESELDMMARLTAFFPVAPTVSVFLQANPGYSVLFIRDKREGVSNPSGFIIDFGGGAQVSVARRVFLVGGIGYHLSFLSTSIRDVDVNVKTRYLHLEAGVGFRL